MVGSLITYMWLGVLSIATGEKTNAHEPGFLLSETMTDFANTWRQWFKLDADGFDAEKFFDAVGPTINLFLPVPPETKSYRKADKSNQIK